MRSTRFSRLRTIPIYLFLLPVFFVFHGYTEFYQLISLPKAITLVLYYLLGTVVVLIFCKFFLKTYLKSALYTFLVMCLYFFFGSFQDFIFRQFPGAFVTRYSFILPAVLLLLIIFFILIKRNKTSLHKLTLYLNVLLLLLFLVDGVALGIKIINRNRRLATSEISSLRPCITCPKPDIYLIVADGYTGKPVLQKFFNYDNSLFENALKQRGFFIADSSFSNYNYTVFSIGSLLNMDHLNIPGYFNGKKDLPVAFDAVRNSKLADYLKTEGYDLFNYSLFDIKGAPRMVRSTLMDFEESPLTTQTFLYRLQKDLGYHLITTLKLKFLQRPVDNTLLLGLSNNVKIDSLTRHVATITSGKPRFVYSHFVMPHWPYYFDSTGKRIPEFMLTDAHHADKNAYLSYLKYSNKKLLDIIDYIQSNTTRPAMIILLSDHGCRECLESEQGKMNYELQNLNAVFLPGKHYEAFYKGISNVNQFRIILNTQFNQRLSLLKDSLTILKKE